MKRDKKNPTVSNVDTSMLMTGEEMHSLDAVCAGLVDATESARRADAELSPDVPDVEAYPALSLEKLHINKSKLKKLIDEMRASLMAAYRSGDTYRRNKLLAHWLCFVYQGAIPLLQKKYQIAIALGKHDAAKKLGDAFAALPPRDKIDHPNGLADIKSEAKHLADEITPDGFCFDIRKAFMLDAEATKEINPKDDEKAQPPIKAVLIGEQAEQLADAQKAAGWTKQELERKKKNAEKTGRKNQRKGEKNGNGRKTDARLKNQIMTEVQQTMRRNKCKQSPACRIVANKHLKADGKTPIFSKRTIENWMCAAKAKKKKNT